MNDDDAAIDELLAAARDLRPPLGAEARSWARFEATLGGPGPTTGGEAAPTKLAWLAPAAKIGGVAAAVLAIGVALSQGADPPHAKRATVTDRAKASPIVHSAPAVPDPAPASSLPPDPSPPSMPAPSDAQPHPNVASRPVAPRPPARVEPVEPSEPVAAPDAEVVVLQRPAAMATPTTNTTDSLRLEAELLGRAWVAIREGRADDTRALLAEHARTFPNGALAPERHACQLVARCSAGEHDAIDRARRYLDGHRASHLAARVAAGCGLRTPSEPSVRSGDEPDPPAADPTR